MMSDTFGDRIDRPTDRSVPFFLSRPEMDKDGDGTVTVEEASYYLMGKAAVDLQTFVEDIWQGFKPVYRPDGTATPPPRTTPPPPAPPTAE